MTTLYQKFDPRVRRAERLSKEIFRSLQAYCSQLDIDSDILLVDITPNLHVVTVYCTDPAPYYEYFSSIRSYLARSLQLRRLPHIKFTVL